MAIGNNNVTCKAIQEIHIRRGLMWNSDVQQLLYVQLFSHNLLTLKNSQMSGAYQRWRYAKHNKDCCCRKWEIGMAIWEYDLIQTNNRVLGGCLEGFSAVWMITSTTFRMANA